MKKVCFAIMGFGKKMDYRNSKEVDLDIIYKTVIKKLFEEEYTQYKLIRGDEIISSDIIDVSMYTLLMKADLVIADITTMNENALYELGVRHALKPYSTIIMMQKGEKTVIPFDLSHSRILVYDDIDGNVNSNKRADIQKALSQFIAESEKQKIDSPLYTYFPQIKPPNIEEEEYETTLQAMSEKEDSIYKCLQKAENFKKESDFANAVPAWENLHTLLPYNEYITQQLALAQYKAKLPNETIALQKALETMCTLQPKDSLDLETLGITGAIYKRLYKLNNNFDYLDEAISLYRKGFIIKNDYYTGENYANCLLFKTRKSNLTVEEITYLKLESKRVYRQVIKIVETSMHNKDIDYWMYATLSTAYFCIDDEKGYQKYKKLFLDNITSKWEEETYNENLDGLVLCLK